MSKDVYKEIPLKSGKFLQIIQDSSPESPRTWDNVGIMVCFHKRYTLGDKHDFCKDDFNSWDEFENHLIEVEKAIVILPLSLYDHSGISMSVGRSSGWDSGIVGFIYVTQHTLDYLGVSQGSGDGILDDETDDCFKARLEKYLKNEVETYDQYLTGDVYGFKLIERVEHNDDFKDIELDSCWGFYGSDPDENGMLSHLTDEDQPLDEVFINN